MGIHASREGPRPPLHTHSRDAPPAPLQKPSRDHDLKTIPLEGVRLSYLLEWIAKARLPAKITTRDFMAEHVMKLTKTRKCSLIETFPRKHVSPTANRFISHSWSYEFARVVQAVADFEREVKGTPLDEVFIWFDTITVNQHKAVDKTYDQEFFATTFHLALERIGVLEVVITPWSDPQALTRAWCLWEIYGAVKKGVRIEIVLPKEERASFIDTLTHQFDTIQKSLSLVDAAKAIAYDKRDLEMIMTAIITSVGISELNRVVLLRLRDWLVETALAAAEAEKGDATTVALLHNNVSRLLAQQGKYADALVYQKRAFEFDVKHFGADSKEVGRDRSNMGYLHSKLGEFPEAQEELSKALAIRRELVRRRRESEHYDAKGADPTTLQDLKSAEARTLFNLGDVSQALGRFNEAAEMYRDAYGSLLDPLQRSEALSMMSEVQRKLSNPRASLELVLEAVALLESTYPNHPTMASALLSAAQASLDLSKTMEALGYLSRAKTICLTRLGEYNTLTAESYSMEAMILNFVGRYGEALEAQSRAMEVDSKMFGPDSLPVARCLNNLGNLEKNLSRLRVAETHLERALTIRQGKLGPDHVYTLHTLSNLCEIYSAMGRKDEALAGFERARTGIAKIRVDHADLVEISMLVARCYYETVGDLYESERILRDALKRVEGAENVQLAAAIRVDLSKVLTDLASFEEAERLLDEATKINGQDDHNRDGGGEAHNAVLMGNIFNSRARLQQARGDAPGAIAWQKRALEVDRRTMGDGTSEWARDLNNLGFLLTLPSAAFRPEEACEALRASLALRLKIFDGDDRNSAVMRTQFNLALGEIESSEGSSDRLVAAVRQLKDVARRFEVEGDNKFHAFRARITWLLIARFYEMATEEDVEALINLGSPFLSSHPLSQSLETLARLRSNELETALIHVNNVAEKEGELEAVPLLFLVVASPASSFSNPSTRAECLEKIRVASETANLPSRHRYVKRLAAMTQ